MVEILFATYNGQKYLREQLDSIFSQTYKDYIITVRDDGSDDDTLGIIEEYIERYPGKIKLLKTETQYNSVKSNFSELLQNVKGEECYYCLCCQDDVWMPNKLEKQVIEMKKLEAISGSRTPVLVHTNMEVVDEKLSVTEKSYVRYANIQPENFSLKKALAENCIIGMSCMFNMALLAISRPIPENAVSHDWWIGLHAIAFGKIGYISEPLVKYRQHSGNTSGAVGGRAADVMRRAGQIKLESKFDTQKSYYQAKALLEENGKILNPEKTKIISKYASFINANKFTKVMQALFGGYAKNSLIASIIQAINS